MFQKFLGVCAGVDEQHNSLFVKHTILHNMQLGIWANWTKKLLVIFIFLMSIGVILQAKTACEGYHKVLVIHTTLSWTCLCGCSVWSDARLKWFSVRRLWQCLVFLLCTVSHIYLYSLPWSLILSPTLTSPIRLSTAVCSWKCYLLPSLLHPEHRLFIL